ncbi:hypothetical protein TcWFU_003392 [Taenia crassiceps]|uniref:Uncharacterized protein n=1 Tax=Taenia crassiceps TaxID=6207 RepID=A0ABR4PZV7_9CEST
MVGGTMMRTVLQAEWFIATFASRAFVNQRHTLYSSLPPKVSGDLISEISVQTRREDAYLMQKYKRRLSMILASTDADEPLSQVRITNLATSLDGRILTVFWTIAEHSHSE